MLDKLLRKITPEILRFVARVRRPRIAGQQQQLLELLLLLSDDLGQLTKGIGRSLEHPPPARRTLPSARTGEGCGVLADVSAWGAGPVSRLQG